MQRFRIAVLTAAAVVLQTTPAPATTRPPSVAVVFHVRAPASTDAAIATADVALRAPEELGEPLAALRRHPGSRLSFAIAPSYLAALDRAAHGGFTASSIAAVNATSSAGDDVLAVLARHRPLAAATAKTPEGARYLTLATSAANRLSGARSAPFSQADIAEFAEDDARVVLASSGESANGSGAADAFAALGRADRAVEDGLRAAVRAGSVDLIALPDDDPVLPLLIDAGGKAEGAPHIVMVGAAHDAQVLIDEAVRTADEFAGFKPGLYSPYGAYDDAVGSEIKSSGATYALFSDRVVHGLGGAGTEGAINAADAAGLRAYALTVDKGVTLPTLFWAEADSADVETALGADTAMSEQVAEAARRAAARAESASGNVLVLRLEADGPWAQRPDARSVVEHLAATLASGRAGPSTTPRLFLASRPALSPAYGFPPAAENGALDYWMGSNDQASLWNALAGARRAAGGDAAIGKPAVRPLLIQAESGAWYAAVGAPAVAAGPNHIDAFRALIAAIYRAAGLQPPAVIAPVKGGPAGVAPTPSPSPTYHPPNRR